MSEMWSGDRAVLVKVVELCESNGDYLEPQRVLDAFPEEQRAAALRSLHRWVDNGYVKAVTTQAMGDRGPQLLVIKGVTEKGLRASGAWPASDEQMAQALLAALDEAVDNAPDDETRSKFKALRSAAAGLGINALGGIGVAAFVKLMGWAG
ncbi:MAG: hypothetical protein ACRDTX_26220 [Pseudonocardiaceae bacterium]